jgi:hypothetical protein
MLPIHSFTGAVHVRNKMWSENTDKAVVKAKAQIFGLLDLFEECANTRHTNGNPLQFEDTILKESINAAQAFIDEARLRQNAMRNHVKAIMALPKLSSGLLLKMQSHAFPEVLMNQVMSFLPAVYRWDSLRLKYTDEFLTEGLKKKSVSRIKSVFNALYKEADSHFDFMKQNEEKTVGQFVKKHPTGYICDALKAILIDTKMSWYNTDKAKKIEAIVTLYKKLEQMTSKWIVKKGHYETACSNMIKILHALVIAVQPKKTKKKVKNPKKSRKITDSAPPMPVFEPENEPALQVPAVAEVPATADGLIEESYTRIGILINMEHTQDQRVAEFVRKMGCEVLAAEVEAAAELIDKCRVILEFAKRNSRD